MSITAASQIRAWQCGPECAPTSRDALFSVPVSGSSMRSASSTAAMQRDWNVIGRRKSSFGRSPTSCFDVTVSQLQSDFQRLSGCRGHDRRSSISLLFRSLQWGRSLAELGPTVLFPQHNTSPGGRIITSPVLSLMAHMHSLKARRGPLFSRVKWLQHRAGTAIPLNFKRGGAWAIQRP